MKKFLVLVVMLAAVVQVYAAPESPTGVSVVKHGSLVKLFYRGEESGTVKVAIYNENGRRIYREVMQNTEDFMRPYNFSELPSGIYFIELTDNNGVKRKKIKHTSPDRTLTAKLTRVNDNEHKYVLCVPNQGSRFLTVRIYGENKKLLYESTEKVNGDFAALYNLNNVEGYRTISVSDGKGHAREFID